MTAKIAKGAEKTRLRQDAWITEYLRNGHNAAAACKTVKIGEKTLYHWKKKEEFNQRLENCISDKSEAVKNIDSDLLARAMARVNRAVNDPFDADSAFKVLEALAPEVWDPRIRAKLWEKSQQKEADQQAPIVQLVRSDVPARLKLVTPSEEKTGTE